MLITGRSAQRLLPVHNPDAFGMGGAQAGFAGGIAMILSAALLAGVKGYDIWFQLKSIASLILGPGTATALCSARLSAWGSVIT
jgi:hypothetical protein